MSRVVTGCDHSSFRELLVVVLVRNVVDRFVNIEGWTFNRAA